MSRLFLSPYLTSPTFLASPVSCSFCLIFPFLYRPSFKKYYQIISPFPLSHLFPPFAFPFPIFFLDPYYQCQQSLMCYSATWTANQVPGDQPAPLAAPKPVISTSRASCPHCLSIHPCPSCPSHMHTDLCVSASWRLKHGKWTCAFVFNVWL